jgi:hypothetical protein
VLALARPAATSQTYPGPASLDQLARRADVVVIGEVVSAVGAWNAAGTTISTHVELAVAETLKGTTGQTLRFTQLGGQVGDLVSTVAGAATFMSGERVLIFLERQPDGSLGLADVLHGRFRVERDPVTGREHAVRATGAPSADHIPLDQVRARVRRALGGTS